MQEYSFLLPICLFLLLGVMSPGPSFLLVAHTAMEKSRTEAIGVSIGMGVGAVIFAIVASVGLFILLDTVPWLYLTLKILGGSYLCFLAFKLWKSASEQVVDNTIKIKAKRGMVKAFFFGLATQLSNPKTAIVFASAFIAFLPQEVPEYSFYIISALAFIIDAAWYILVATLLSTSKAQSAYAKFKKHICRAASGFMGIMGVKLLTNQQLP